MLRCLIHSPPLFPPSRIRIDGGGREIVIDETEAKNSFPGLQAGQKFTGSDARQLQVK